MNALIDWLRKALGIVASTSAYGAVGLSTGGLTALFSKSLGLDPYTCFFFGFCLPFGPLYLLFTSRRAMTNRLSMLREWKNAGLIQAREYDKLGRQLLRWYSDRMFRTLARGPAPLPTKATEPESLPPRNE